MFVRFGFAGMLGGRRGGKEGRGEEGGESATSGDHQVEVEEASRKVGREGGNCCVAAICGRYLAWCRGDSFFCFFLGSDDGDHRLGSFGRSRP